TLGSKGYVETLVGGQQATGNDFGNFQQATKSGRKFNDLNGDGVEQATEPGLSGWTIKLDGTDSLANAVHLSTTTDASGAYSFNINPGSSTVCEVLQRGCPQTFPVGSKTYVVTLASGQHDSGNDFGNFQQATKSGRKFNDLNGNGKEDAGEPGLSGWTIKLDGTDGLGKDRKSAV